MGFLSEVTEILDEFPFDEKGEFLLNSSQCRALSSFFTSKLETFFGSVLVPSSLNSTSTLGRPLRGWNSFSVFQDKKFPRHSRKKNYSCATFMNHGSDGESHTSVFAILDELKNTPYAIEELYRVVKEAEKYLHTCNDSDWWWGGRVSTLGNVKEARDVHMHDLLWCIVGLNLALYAVRGVELVSRAHFVRFDIAKCYGEMSGDSEMTECEENDYYQLLSSLEKIKRNCDEMNVVRKMIMNTHEKAKHDIVHFMLQKLRGLEATSSYAQFPPKSMEINIKDIIFSTESQKTAQGSSSNLYEASWHGIRVVVKKFEYHASKEPFDYELRVLSTAQCPFVVQLYGWSINIEECKCYLILERVSTNLSSLVKKRKNLRKPLQLPVVVDLMLQVSRAMEHLHFKHMIHQNIRPSNILIEPLSSSKELAEKGYGRVKLWNFGSGRLDIEKSHVKTLRYRAPEVWAPTPFDQPNFTFESDVYSFAMSFAYIFTGEEPFASITSRFMMKKMVEEGMRPKLPTNCPPVLRDLLVKCWATDPSSRLSFAAITMKLRHLKLLIMKTRASEGMLSNSSMVEKEHFLSVPVISYSELLAATNKFAKLAPSISIYSIYHGFLSDGTKVLVRQEAHDNTNMRRLWVKISQMLSFRHSNVVGLRAVSIHASQCWYIYEDKTSGVKGSLDTWLESQTFLPLDLASCYRIALGAACGLQYLHEQGVVFAVTAETILLDEMHEPVIMIDPVAFCQGRSSDNIDLDYHRSLDVLHFGTLIAKLLSYLLSSSINEMVTLDGSRQDAYQIRVLNKVESLCSGNDVTMEEVVEMLEMGSGDGDPLCEAQQGDEPSLAFFHNGCTIEDRNENLVQQSHDFAAGEGPIRNTVAHSFSI